MRRWIDLAAALYPARWRAEYGEEFREVLSNIPTTWRTLGNVLRGAIAMQITISQRWLKWIAITATAGALLAGALSLIVMPAKYLSSAIIQVTPTPDPVRPASSRRLEERAAGHVGQEEEELLSRTNLEGIIMAPAFDLYKEERQRMPMENIVAQMRRDIEIRTLPPQGTAPRSIRSSISFQYPDQAKAQAVTKVLVTKFAESSLAVNRAKSRLYQAFWDDQARQGDTRHVPPPPSGEDLAVLTEPNLPTRADGPGRVAFIALGMATGALLGVLLALAWQRRRGGWILAGAAVSGLLLAGALSFLIPNNYTSTAIMRITPAMITADPLATPPIVTAADFLRQAAPAILNRDNMEQLILKPRLDLYRKERTRVPIKQLAEKMLARDIRVTPVSLKDAPASASAFSISFTHPDPYKARATVRELLSQFTEQNMVEARAKARFMSATQQDIERHKAGRNLEVLDPPSLPEAPDEPNRAAIAAAGLALGILTGLIALRRRPPSPTAHAS